MFSELRGYKVNFSCGFNNSAGKETPAAYLKKHIFPVLLPGIEETLQVAKRTEVRSISYQSTHLL